MSKESIQEAIRKYEEKAGKRLNPKAVLFDMDGVLYDSMRFHARAWREVTSRHHIIASDEDFYLHEGRTGASIINVLIQRTFSREATEAEKVHLYEEKAALFNQYNDGEAMPGAADVLREVAKTGLQSLVVTGSGQKSLIDKLNHTYPGCFSSDKMVTAFDVKYGKPNPEPYLMGLQKAGVQAHEAIVIENAPLGVRAGVQAGIFTIAVNTGPLPDEVLLQEGANLLYPSMSALAEEWSLLVVSSSMS
ncbi:MAG TPA: HAD-IA family hydrolase [Candidatus Parabacteroides intestinavium]|nr:HAD-IA family hydrolase [Candidatus Parabacteroides intestinavium]